MAAIGTLYPTLVDYAKKLDPQGKIAPVLELLTTKNAFMQDLAWKEGNLVTGHRFSARAGLPSPTWRKINQGIAAAKAATDTFEESCGMLEGLAKVDCALAELNGNAAAFRADEDNAFTAGFGETVASAMFYSDAAVNPEQFHGLTPRFDVTSGNRASAQIIKCDASASGADQTSIWLVGWSPSTVYGIFPKASKAGFSSEDLGRLLVKDSGGTNEFLAYVTHHKWNLGLVVEDYRYVSRLCNIDTSAWTAASGFGGNDLCAGMMDQLSAIYSPDAVQLVYYMNRSAFSMFNKQLKASTVNYLEYIERGGTLVPHFLGVPIRICDAIVKTEAIVV